MTTFSPVPKLLVSVRDAAEAVSAVQGSADIVDFKNPDRGPLGRADVEVMSAAIGAMERVCTCQPDGIEGGEMMTLSAAMGEAIEITGPFSERLPGAVRYLKLGLAGLRNSSDWVGAWLRARSVVERQAGDDVKWAAVAYADADAAEAPPVAEVVQAAARTGCAGVLVDTFDKSSGRLLDHCNAKLLRELGDFTRSRKMFFAVAGRLQVGDLPALYDVRPDIIAVRSAVCEGENRSASVESSHVAAVRLAIRRTFDPQGTLV